MRTTDSEPFAINNSEEPQNQVEEVSNTAYVGVGKATPDCDRVLTTIQQPILVTYRLHQNHIVATAPPSSSVVNQAHSALTLSNIRSLAAALNLPSPSPNCLAMQLVEYDRMMRRRAAAEALLNSLKLNNKDQNPSSE
ncbi:hypothetical protein PRIPAC_95964 [Pristionchus pacificus]|uniref:Uncharacterized protein n=1 Tax=Pristionchus pacificus TaxID=54126 RepID=A0A2A6CUJ6_PRIPA|nr:hypothetical protein PRIPAC_95964 [Pristionchus pacificus]|eukprot:PDM81902.1 hypothetical protein PRIPAC_34056 [Pristionchus pacificus]